jgi:hypothetical protein
MTDGRSTALAPRLSWLVLLVISGLLFLYGVMWYFTGSEMALENIAERTPLTPDDFRSGSPSAFDVITIVARQGAAFTAGLGLATVALAWQGLRSGSRSAWWAAWSLPLAIAAFGAGFILPTGIAPQGLMFIGLAGVTAAALLVARPAADR